MKNIIKYQIVTAQRENKLTPTTFDITPEEHNTLENIQEELFAFLNELPYTLTYKTSDDILMDYIIAIRIYPNITIQEFVSLYTADNYKTLKP